MYEVNRRPKGRQPLFCFISVIGIYYPLTDIVIVKTGLVTRHKN
jgi:hypothetical protein